MKKQQQQQEQQHKPLVLVLLFIILFSQSTQAIDFVFNGFTTSSSSSLLLYGSAIIDPSRILSLTNQTNFEIGRALYPTKIPTKDPNSSLVYPFSTSFIFAMAPYKNVLPGHGLVFLFVPYRGLEGTSSAQNLGFLNRTNDGNPNNHIFGVEFDVFQNQEFNDINDNHVGIDVNSLTSVAAEKAGYWLDGASSSSTSDDEKSFKTQKLNNGKNYQVWIDYADSVINVTIAPVGIKRPSRPLLSVPLNLSDVFEDEMFVGFTASTGQLVQSHKILAWSFSNSNFSLSDRLITTGLPSFVLPKESVVKSKGFIAGVTIGGVFVAIFVASIVLFLVRRRQRRAREREDMEDWELEYWPHRITYQELEAATKGFAEENVIGIGGNGKVYKGVLPGGAEVAVKRISHENDGMREFLAEISSLGRLKHRSLVGLRVMCGRRPIEEGQPSLVEMVWKLMVQGQLLNALDARLRARGGFDEEEVETVLHLGLMCAYPDPSARPTMRQVVKVLDGKTEPNEADSEDVDAYLLHQMKSKEMWLNYSQSFSSGSHSHPTIDEIRQYQSTSMSLTWSNTEVEGRFSEPTRREDGAAEAGTREGQERID
ncbi:hypothetical protein Tsubulata_030125 [Turnera subulata]|uniref:Protein kinase domain-containing protein n=1 Tax=Turnera subulata TaxID=218843 RepID=A0A9Q0JFS3_9ROSI|nr:hypothetical protein Tsubulata_030125 [Turnera subulata]